MDFRTEVELPEKSVFLRYSDKIMFIGSCFSENIGKKFADAKFQCDINPYGVLYNPSSIACALRELMQRKLYTADDEALVDMNGWHSLHHHGDFSAETKEDCVDLINKRLQQTYQQFFQTDVLFITWGTSWIYRWKQDGQIVANCHKIPASYFVRERLDVSAIVTDYSQLIEDFRSLVNPRLKIIFTVSPIRHRKDGFHENQLSKSVLLLAIDALQKKFADTVYYFPAYELMMDELRDYRFYADDMLHPSPLAVDYIWERLCKCFFSMDTMKIIDKWAEICRGLAHHPFHPQSDVYRRFLNDLLLKMNQFKEKYPYFDLQKELNICHILLKQSQI